MWEPPEPPPTSWEAPTDPGLGRIPPLLPPPSPPYRPPLAAQPNTAQPNTAQPNTAQPNTAQPNTAQPNTAQPPSLLDLHPGPPAETDAAQSRTVNAVIGLIVLVLLAGATILVVSRLSGHHVTPVASSTSGSGSPPSATPKSRPTATTTSAKPTARPAPVPAGQVAAKTVSGDITTSVAARKLIGPANNAIAACRATSKDVQALQRAATIRTGLVTDLGRLDVHALSGGAAVVARLRTAWTYSARADSAYAAWGQHHLGCTGHAKTTGDRDWTRAQHNDAQSTAAKKAAVTLWNPIARRYHLAKRTSGTI